MHRASVAVGLIAMAACGDGVTLTDAAIGSDGPERGRVSVHVAASKGAGPITVYFQDADSTLVLATRTNDAGDASALMASGGFVTVFPSGHLYTWANVQIGDELTLDLSAEELSSFPALTVRLAELEGAQDYWLSSRCERERLLLDPKMLPVAPFFLPCTPRSDLLLVAYDINFEPFGYRYIPNANMLDSTPVNLGASYLPIASTVDVYGPTDRTITVTQRLTNVDYSANAFVQVTDTHVVAPIGMPVIDGTTVQGVAYMTSSLFPPQEDEVMTSEYAAFAWGPNGPTMTLDLSTPDLREITSKPTLELESYTLKWMESDVGSRGDAVWAEIAIYAGIAILPWTIMAPRTDETLVRLPVLPYDGAQLRPESAVDNFALLSSEGGYDRLRPYLLGHWSPLNAAWWPMHEPSGRASYRSAR